MPSVFKASRAGGRCSQFLLLRLIFHCDCSSEPFLCLVS